MIYSNLKELGNNILHLGDIVYFYPNGKQLKYSVQSNHLSNIFKCDNSEIFTILGISKDNFCNNYYGYYSYGGDWPACRIGDFRALTRVVRELYQEIERKKTQENVIHSYGNLMKESDINLSDVLSNSFLTAPLVLKKEENTSSNILIKRKSKIKRIIGEEPIKLNNY